MPFDGVSTQGHGTAVPVVALVYEPGLAQHAEVMGAGGLGDRKVKGAARAFAACGSGRELGHDATAGAVGERGEYPPKIHDLPSTPPSKVCLASYLREI